MNIEIFADGANLTEMIEQYKGGEIDGFTTNPSLMKKGGVTDYNQFAKDVITAIPDLSLSFEVFADDFETMEAEARKIATFGDNVFVKIPIMNTKGESAIPLIKKLSAEGININVTALYTVDQVREVVEAVNDEAVTYASVFAGRLADVGIDPVPVIVEAEKLCHSKKNVKLLWASTREVYNVIQADELGCDIITCPPDVLKKLPKIGSKTPLELSKDTVIGFNNDIKDLGFSIL